MNIMAWLDQYTLRAKLLALLGIAIVAALITTVVVALSGSSAPAYPHVGLPNGTYTTSVCLISSNGVYKFIYDDNGTLGTQTIAIDSQLLAVFPRQSILSSTNYQLVVSNGQLTSATMVGATNGANCGD